MLGKWNGRLYEDNSNGQGLTTIEEIAKKGARLLHCVFEELPFSGPLIPFTSFSTSA